MSIRPVDFQIMMPKVNEVGRVQSEQQQRQVGHEQHQVDSSVRQADHNTKSVHSQDEANKAVINEKQKDRNKKKSQKRPDEEEDKLENKDSIEKKDGRLPQERHTIDIRL